MIGRERVVFWGLEVVVVVKWRVKREVEFVKRFWRVSDIVCNCIKCVATGYKFVGVFFLRNESTWLGFWGAALISKHTHT